jgi:hypothetical protein
MLVILEQLHDRDTPPFPLLVPVGPPGTRSTARNNRDMLVA